MKEVKQRMKVKISYLPQEERDAAAALTALQLRHPDGRTRRSDRHPPYRQIYFSVSGEKDSCKEEKDAL